MADYKIRASEVRERANQLLRERGITENSVASGDSAAQKRLNSQLSHGAAISLDTLLHVLAACPDVSADWLLTGKVPIYTEAISSKRPKNGIPFYENLQVSAGRLDVITQDAQPSGWINLPGVTAKALFPVVGCSMQPEINPGDIIGVVQLDSWEVMDPDKVYLVITNDDRMIKHLATDETDSSILWCISSNYPRFKIDREDIKFIYRVTFCGKLM